MKKVLFGLLTLSVIGTACKKDKDKPAITKENIAGTYIVTAATIQAGNGTPSDLLANLEPCEKDDKSILSANGTYQYIDAGTQCDPPGDYTGDWSLDGNSITMDGEVATITNFDGSNLEVTLTYTDSGVTWTIRTTYKKQ